MKVFGIEYLNISDHVIVSQTSIPGAARTLNEDF